MFTPIVRLLILIFLAGTSVVMAMQGKIWVLILSSFLSLYLLWDYAVNQTLPLAYRRLLKQDYEGAIRALDYIGKPERLSDTASAKYFAIKGLVAHHRDEFEEANRLLQLSLSYPNKDKKLKIMVLLALTDIALIQRKNRVAKDWFQQLDGMSIPKYMMPTVLKLEEFIKAIIKQKNYW